MKKLMMLLFVGMLVIGTTTLSNAATSYDAFSDFSISNGNPNGVWSYGKTDTLAGNFTIFTDIQTSLVPGVQYWQSGVSQDPGVAKNITGSDIVIQWGWPFITWPGNDYLSLHGGPNFEFAVLRWTAPNSGVFTVNADFQALNTFPTRSDIYVLRNNVPIFSSWINLNGHGDAENFSANLTIQSGDTVDFVVGLGDFYCANSTGLKAIITYDMPIVVDMDIKPGSHPNSINLGSNGVIPVAILGSETLDATTVDPLSVRLEGAGVRLNGKSGNAGSIQDANGDGFADLVVHIIDFTLAEGATTANLTGNLFDGTPIHGSDSINVVPPQ